MSDMPQGEISISRLATTIFSALALMFAFGALVVSARHNPSSEAKAAAGTTMVEHGVVADSAAASSPADARIDASASPAAGWKPFDPTLAPAPGGTVHTVTLETTEKVLEVAPGVTHQMWTFNGQVPGPILRGKVGDVFNVTLVNKGTMSQFKAH